MQPVKPAATVQILAVALQAILPIDDAIPKQVIELLPTHWKVWFKPLNVTSSAAQKRAPHVPSSQTRQVPGSTFKLPSWLSTRFTTVWQSSGTTG
ncbi:hypothetical protein PG991_014059 [Apiospora marii]|uniref:Uncharacterized protein n=1 Tax=Apiospora marii TaxID=335849 RepID=A0ABR1R7W9_9PEZI